MNVVRRTGGFRAVRAHADRRGAVPPLHPAGGAGRPGRGHRLQARLHRLQDRAGPRRPRAAHGARVDHPRQPARPAARLCPAVQPVRAQQGARSPAALPAGRLEGRLPAAGDGVRAFLVPGQHRGRADRRHHGHGGVPQKGAHRLPGGGRRLLERRRRRQRGGRHHHHHDVDRRRQPADRARRLHRRGGGPGGVRRAGRHPAAALRADRQGRPGRAPRRLGARGDSGDHPAPPSAPTCSPT